MEDALARLTEQEKELIRSVLILVLMEDALAHTKGETKVVFVSLVLILVLMEDALAHVYTKGETKVVFVS